MSLMCIHGSLSCDHEGVVNHPLTITPGVYSTFVVGFKIAYSNIETGYSTSVEAHIVFEDGAQLLKYHNWASNNHVYTSWVLTGDIVLNNYSYGVGYHEFKFEVTSSTTDVYAYYNGDLITTQNFNTTSSILGSPIKQISMINSSGGYTNISTRDHYILNSLGTVNNDVIGPCEVTEVLPNNFGSHNDFTPSENEDHYVLVSDPASNNTYIEADQTGSTDSFMFSNLDPSLGNIQGVRVDFDIEKTEPGVRSVAALAKHNTVESLSDNLSLLQERSDRSTIIEVNPSTSAKWTTEEFNNTEFGIKITE